MSRKILFIAEDITLAQIVRLKCLSDSINNEGYQVYFASSFYHGNLLGTLNAEKIRINVIDPIVAENAVYQCKRIYKQPTIEKYVEEDLQLFDQIKPDFIIGDFRLSLSISARLAKIPFAVLINAYWNPAIRRQSFPMPDHPYERFLGYPLMNFFYALTRPMAFKYFAHPFNTIRKKYQLPPLGSLQDLLTYGDYVLYPDTPYIAPVNKLPSHHFYLGPILWSPDIEISYDLKKIMEQPFIYVTLGSSGRTNRVRELLEGLARLPYQVVMASANKYDLQKRQYKNIFVTDFVPGSKVAEKASLVISNGGSTTSYQALEKGTPVLGLPSNLDQYLCMQNIGKLGAGKFLRAGSFTSQEIQDTAKTILENTSYTKKAQLIQDDMRGYNSSKAFVHFLKNSI